MFNLHQIRSRQEISTFCQLLETMALDRRLYHGLAASPTASRSSSSHGRGNGNGNSKSKGSTVNSSGIYANGNSMTRQIQTTASSPSLRSAAAAHAHAIVAPSSPLVSEVESYCDADSMIMRGGDQQQSSEGGNVKVVVRVRAFVKRGELLTSSTRHESDC